MDFSRRLRILFLFAAFLLGLSVCFVYAEDAPQASSAPAVRHPALWVGPTHSNFLRSAPEAALTLTATSSLSPAAPIASRALLSEVDAVSHSHRHLLRLGRTRSRELKVRPAADSAILEMLSHSQSGAEAR